MYKKYFNKHKYKLTIKFLNLYFTCCLLSLPSFPRLSNIFAMSTMLKIGRKRKRSESIKHVKHVKDVKDEDSVETEEDEENDYDENVESDDDGGGSSDQKEKNEKTTEKKDGKEKPKRKSGPSKFRKSFKKVIGDCLKEKGYVLGQFLGRGKLGRVYVVQSLNSNSTDKNHALFEDHTLLVARIVKITNAQILETCHDRVHYQSFQVKHMLRPKTHWWNTKEDYYFFISEYCPQNLEHVLQTQFVGANAMTKWFAQILAATRPMHHSGLLFRNLQLHNILLDINGDVVIDDFDLEFDLHHLKSNTSTTNNLKLDGKDKECDKYDKQATTLLEQEFDGLDETSDKNGGDVEKIETKKDENTNRIIIKTTPRTKYPGTLHTDCSIGDLLYYYILAFKQTKIEQQEKFSGLSIKFPEIKSDEPPGAGQSNDNKVKEMENDKEKETEKKTYGANGSQPHKKPKISKNISLDILNRNSELWNIAAKFKHFAIHSRNVLLSQKETEVDTNHFTNPIWGVNGYQELKYMLEYVLKKHQARKPNAREISDHLFKVFAIELPSKIIEMKILAASSPNAGSPWFPVSSSISEIQPSVGIFQRIKNILKRV